MEFPNTIGLIAGAFTASGFLPQLIKAWKTKSTKDVSGPMLAIFAIGIALWLVYGILIKAPPIIIANALTLTFVTGVIVLKLKYK
ncbi:MAG: SemiSWEET transporter [candidate division Zixibacteria bacterium]|nr:SemiSWEET transporter [Candidatus Tariuqbacter arcticus]